MSGAVGINTPVAERFMGERKNDWDGAKEGEELILDKETFSKEVQVVAVKLPAKRTRLVA